MTTIKDQVLKCGYAFMAEYKPEKTASEIIDSIGKILKLGTGSPVHVLVPTALEVSAPNTYSGLYGMKSFPFHTDMAHWRLPPRYLMLRCVVGFEEVPTLLTEGVALAKEVGLDLLARAIVRPRRPINGKFPLLRIYQPKDEDAILRWDDVFFLPASQAGEQAVALFRQAVHACSPQKIALAKPGDTLIIDNWRMLHARTSVPIGCEGRKIERVYIGELH